MSLLGLLLLGIVFRITLESLPLFFNLKMKNTLLEYDRKYTICGVQIFQRTKNITHEFTTDAQGIFLYRMLELEDIGNNLMSHCFNSVETEV